MPSNRARCDLSFYPETAANTFGAALRSYQAFKTACSRHTTSLLPPNSSCLSNLNGSHQAEDICDEDVCCGAMCARLSGGCRSGRGCHLLWSRVCGTSNGIWREVQS